MSAPAYSNPVTLAASGPPARNGVVEIVVLVALLLLVGYTVWRRRVLRRRYHLSRRQRAARLSAQWLEPLAALLLVAGVLAKDVAAGSAHLVALLTGALIGAVLGVVRGHYMLGRARRVGDRLLLERNWQELVIIFLLVALQMLQREVSATSTSAFALISTGLLSAGVFESVGRVAFLTVRARSATPAGADDRPPPSGPGAGPDAFPAGIPDRVAEIPPAGAERPDSPPRSS